MTKDDMILVMSEEAGISKKQAGEALQSFMKGITTELIQENKVSFAGFGTFSVSHRKARIGRNPQTGAQINIPASRVPVFKAGKHLKDAVRK